MERNQRLVEEMNDMILPADSYIVINKTVITEMDKQILIDLYQPIIGSRAVSLYLTLLNDLEKKLFVSGNLRIIIC